jgi:hypothetical protein
LGVFPSLRCLRDLAKQMLAAPLPVVRLFYSSNLPLLNAEIFSANKWFRSRRFGSIA